MELILWLAAGYIAVVAVMYLAQTHLIFPTYLLSLVPAELPSSAERLRLAASDGTDLAGVLFTPDRTDAGEALLLLGFGGNVWNVENMALLLHRHVPSAYVAGFHYRGYRPSGGRPSARALLADALEIFDVLQARLPARPIIAVGFSIGSPVAAYLARHRPVAGVVLVTPFDSLVALARDHFRWLPVRLLLRHRMPTADYVRDLSSPVAMIVAGRDSVVPARRSEPLRRVIPNLVSEEIIPEAEHNDLYDRPEFWDAFRRAIEAVSANRDS